MTLIFNNNQDTKLNFYISVAKEQFLLSEEKKHLIISLPYDAQVMQSLEDFFKVIKLNSITILNNNNKEIYHTVQFIKLLNLSHIFTGISDNSEIFIEFGQED